MSLAASPGAAMLALRIVQAQIEQAGGWDPDVPTATREAMENRSAEQLLVFALSDDLLRERERRDLRRHGRG